MLRPIVVATAVAGTLDILFAMILTVTRGAGILNMLRFVGSGPFPQATEMGAAGAILGLLVHFALIAIMAAVYVFAARRVPALTRQPLLWGVLYGLATYFVMNWLVVPVRFDAPMPVKPMQLATQLFAHIALAGIPITIITARSLRARTGR